jgi:tyrosine-protein phosphatase YwqE
MNLDEFLSLGEEHVISPEEAKSLNDFLAKISAQDIPIIHKARVADYLLIAFNMNSVESHISPALDLLLSELLTHA